MLSYKFDDKRKVFTPEIRRVIESKACSIGIGSVNEKCSAVQNQISIMQSYVNPAARSNVAVQIKNYDSFAECLILRAAVYLDAEDGDHHQADEEQTWCEHEEACLAFESYEEQTITECRDGDGDHDEFKDEELGAGSISMSVIEIDHHDNRRQSQIKQRRFEESDKTFDNDDSEHFLDACQVTIILSKAAYRYGTPTGRLAEFAAKIMESYGYPKCYFGATRTEFLC
jgi:hypothetical protein